MSQTNAMKAKIAIARKQLGLDDATYRDMLHELTGQRSSKNCSDAQLARVIDHLAQRGAVFTNKKNTSKAPYKAKVSQRRSDFYEIPASSPHSKKKQLICALWRDLGYSLTSLDTRVKRQYGVEVFLWCHDERALNVIIVDLQKRLAAKHLKKKKEENAA